MANKKILLIDQFNKIGGGQSVLIDLINVLNNNKFECTVAIPTGGYIESNVSDASFYYLSNLNLNSTKKNIVDFFLMLFHFLREIKIIKQIKKNDIIYVNGPRYYLMFYFFSYLIKRKYIYHIHLDFSNFGKRVIKLLSKQKNTFAIVFTSNYLLSEYLMKVKVDDNNERKKLVVIEPGVSEKYSSKQIRVNPFKNNRNYNFLSVGRIYPEKGFDTIIKIAKFYKECNFYIVGEPEATFAAYFKMLNNEAGPNVFFLGKSNNIPQVIIDYNIDFGIVPSVCNEAFGIVAIELMLCSCITFVNNKGGLVDIAKKTGGIVFNDVDSLKAKINSVIFSTQEQIKSLSNIQYQNTKSIYADGAFARKITALLSAIVIA